MKMQEIIIYETVGGVKPLENWFTSIKDPVIRFRISSRIERVKTGNLGDWKSIDEGINELRLQYGSGFRIYFSKIENVVVLFLCGGDKSSQSRDIKKAKEYLKDYMERIKNEK